MTDTVATGSETTPTESDDLPKTAEEVAAEEAEAAAGFESGFNKVRPPEEAPAAQADAGNEEGEPQAKQPEPKVEPTAAEKAAQVEAAKQAEREKFYNELPEKIRKLEGQYGGVSERLNKVLDTVRTKSEKAGADAPTERQINAALKDPAAMDKLVKEYEDFKPIQTELEAMQGQMSKFVTADQVLKQVEERNAKLREVISLDTRHPGWESVINSDEFITHVLQGGPSKDEYGRYNKLLNSKSPADQTAAAKIEQQWSYQHPQWWGQRGADFIGGTVDKSIQILDEFKASRETAATAAAAALKKEKRLKGAITPQGGGAAVTTGIPDEEGFERGFKKVHARR